jgi:threonylcarbamoyladenosine tRNA methylthiotransferase MtaB
MSLDVVTFGCRLNIAESEVIRGAAAAAGVADAVVFNTCAVTGEAVKQARQAIRKARRARPDAKIVVTGCAAQADPGMFAAMPEVDRVLGNEEKLSAAHWSAPIKIAVGDIMAVTDTAVHRVGHIAGHTRAFLQVQNGCDHRCTFCIIPFGRGNSRSVPPAEVVAQARLLVENGHREIVLTGVDITSYAPGLGLLVKQILREVPELKRLRLSSIDSVEVDADLLDALATDDRLMPHLHLSLQAGDDLILKRMKRRHSRQQAIDFCAQVRRLRPDIAFGADIIAGFPTETEEMSVRSQDLIDECGLTFLHVFPYSPRPSTPAARMPQVATSIARDRARRLRAAGDTALRKRLEAEIGATRQVLIESATQGRTEHFLPVAISGETPGAVRALAIKESDGARLLV